MIFFTGIEGFKHTPSLRKHLLKNVMKELKVKNLW